MERVCCEKKLKTASLKSGKEKELMKFHGKVISHEWNDLLLAEVISRKSLSKWEFERSKKSEEDEMNE